MNLIFFDGPRRNHLLPLTYTRPVCDLRIGILTIREKWEKQLELNSSTITQDYLSQKHPLEKGKNNLLVNGSTCFSKSLLDEITALEINQGITKNGEIVALLLNEKGLAEIIDGNFESFKLKEARTSFNKINNLWDIFALNGAELELDFQFLTKGRKSAKAPENSTVLAPENVFIEEGAEVECAILNGKFGKIYLGKDSRVSEGAVIRGPFALCEHSEVKMAAKIYGPTTIGPHCKVGGEISNSILYAYSNKGHDGFLGNSVIGEWVNIGADTNNSNLKNNYAPVKLWSYPEGKFTDTGLQFCGLIMGDHAKCGINTMFNTGTVVGVAANVFGAGFPRNFIPDFSWGGPQGIVEHSLSKAYETAETMMARRKIELSDTEKAILKSVFDQTQSLRK
jgi:UDP-N-acetylglucosamine diphosphorylase/glucosamine-1-phosphate N-acetyltransferase